ncbi:hypothetical protein [Clostridium akagii]|uniref:hypothetical protein n=1 Tax=Clostridium akagii TaxID=91623 RepID=UPI00047D0AF4|nr:hypothetical protein [Clostridium akagii]
MFKFEDIISGNYSQYPEEIQKYMENYSELLRDKIKDELIKNKTDKMLKNIDKSNETFITVLSEILENGTKGYNKMSTKTLIDMYLDIKSPEEFATMLESINDEI